MEIGRNESYGGVPTPMTVMRRGSRQRIGAVPPVSGRIARPLLDRLARVKLADVTRSATVSWPGRAAKSQKSRNL
jgi:hypothetical protein